MFSCFHCLIYVYFFYLQLLPKISRKFLKPLRCSRRCKISIAKTWKIKKNKTLNFICDTVLVIFCFNKIIFLISMKNKKNKTVNFIGDNVLVIF